MENNESDIINIRVTILHSRTFCLQVHKQIPIPMLRGHIAMATGIPAHNQRLLYDGQVLSDEHVLSKYNIQDGITIHLVIQQPSHFPFQSMPYHSVPAGPARFQGQTSNSFAMGGAVPNGDSELMRRIILSLMANYAVSFDANPPASFDVPDAMTSLRRELDMLNRLYQTNGGIVLGGNMAAPPQNPHQHVDRTPESLTNLYQATRPLLNNVLDRMHTLAMEIQMQRFVSDYMQRWNIQRSAWTLGTQLQDVGTFLLELGRITSILTISPTNSPPGFELPSGPAVYLDMFQRNRAPAPVQAQQPRYSSQTGTSVVASAAARVMPNTGPDPSSMGNQVRVAPAPDLTASEDESVNGRRSQKRERDPRPSSSNDKHQKRQR